MRQLEIQNGVIKSDVETNYFKIRHMHKLKNKLKQSNKLFLRAVHCMGDCKTFWTRHSEALFHQGINVETIRTDFLQLEKVHYRADFSLSVSSLSTMQNPHNEPLIAKTFILAEHLMANDKLLPHGIFQHQALPS